MWRVSTVVRIYMGYPIIRLQFDHSFAKIIKYSSFSIRTNNNIITNFLKTELTFGVSEVSFLTVYLTYEKSHFFCDRSGFLMTEVAFKRQKWPLFFDENRSVLFIEIWCQKCPLPKEFPLILILVHFTKNSHGIFFYMEILCKNFPKSQTWNRISFP